MKKILFAISSLWLWHATRSLVIINHFLNKWYEVDIVSYWNALNFLKSEIKNEKVIFFELKDYPPLERWKWVKHYVYLTIDIVKTKKTIKKENSFLKSIEKKYDFIFSDWRYGFHSKNKYSFLISHQLNFIMPKWLKFLWKIVNYSNYRYLRKFNHILIPDYQNINNSLAWYLSHPEWLNKINHTYIWILSSLYNNLNNNEKIDYLFTISWYLTENKDSFINYLIDFAKKLEWKKVFVLWDAKNNYEKKLENNITIYSYVCWEKRKELFKKADIIISRAWYTTIMDLVELEKKAILFPTPNQTEQEYLAIYLENKWHFVFGNENNDLEKLEKKVRKKEINFWWKNKTIDSLSQIDNIINKIKHDWICN